jgi:hypothetical protein
MFMRRLTVLLSSLLLAAVAAVAVAQVVPSATARQFSITVGGTASIFQSDYEGGYVCEPASCYSSNPNTTIYYYPAAGASSQPLYGVGTYVDVRVRRWMQFEAEARWQRFNAYTGITQDNYLVGPRLPLYRIWKATVYGKALGGIANMNFGDAFGGAKRNYADIAMGGGVDLKLTKHLSLRAADVEYQYWPSWNRSTLSPYGVSVGVGYKFF